jgi:hypothetical protein
MTKSNKGLRTRLAGFRTRMLAGLVRWCVLMATMGYLLIIILESARSQQPVANVGDYIAIVTSLRSQLGGYSITIAGYSLMLLVCLFSGLCRTL